MTESDTPDEEQQPLLSRQISKAKSFEKKLNAVDGFNLLIGCIIGSGIFTSSAAVDANTPSPVAALLVFLLGGLLAWSGALSFAELGTALPGEGGIQSYLRYIYGDFAGFIAAWAWIVAIIPTALSILSIVFVDISYGIFSSAEEQSTVLRKLLSIAVFLVNVAINCQNTKTSARLNGAFSVIKILSLCLPVLAASYVLVAYSSDYSKDLGSRDWHDRNWISANKANWSGISKWEALGRYSSAIFASLWAFCGWDGASFITGELQNPGKQLPLALNSALLLVILSYILVNASYYVLLPWNTISLTNGVAVKAIQELMGNVAGIAFALIICLVVAGAISANVFLVGRLTVAASRKNYIPRFFSHLGHMLPRSPDRELHVRNTDRGTQESDVPYNAILLNITITIFYILLGNFRILVNFVGLAQYTFFFFAVLGAVILRIREPDLERSFKPPIAILILFSIVCLSVVVRGAFSKPLQFLVLSVELIVGAGVYKIKESILKTKQSSEQPSQDEER